MRRPPPSSSGQASLEYAGLLLVVALLVSTAAALTAGGIGDRIAWAIRRGICAVTDTSCPPAPRAQDFPPCLLHAHERDNDTTVTLGVVDLGRGRSLRMEGYSDGHVEVSFGDDASAGASVGLWATLRAGAVEGGAGVEVGGTWGVGRGQMWRFADAASARRFVRRWGRRQTRAGGLLHDLHAACVLCRWLGHGPAAMPAPAARWVHGDQDLHADAYARLHYGGEAMLTMEHRTLGLQVARDGSRVRYLASGSGFAAAVVAGTRHVWQQAATSEVEVAETRGGRPTSVTVRTVRGSGRARGTLEEIEARMPVTSAADVAAVRSLFRGLPADQLEATVALRPFFARLGTAGMLTVRRFRLRTGRNDLGAALRLGAGLRGGLGRDSTQTDLVSVATKLPGLPWLPRADCLPA